jgi:hypothetical protein
MMNVTFSHHAVGKHFLPLSDQDRVAFLDTQICPFYSQTLPGKCYAHFNSNACHLPQDCALSNRNVPWVSAILLVYYIHSCSLTCALNLWKTGASTFENVLCLLPWCHKVVAFGLLWFCTRYLSTRFAKTSVWLSCCTAALGALVLTHTACMHLRLHTCTHAETVAKLAASFDLIRESACAKVFSTQR